MIQANAHIILDESELSITVIDYLAGATFKLVGQMRLHVHVIQRDPGATESYWLGQLRAIATAVHILRRNGEDLPLRILREFGGVIIPRRFACRSPITSFLLTVEELVSTFTLVDGSRVQVLGLARGSSKTPETEIQFSPYQDLSDPVTQFLLWRAHKQEDKIPVVAYDHLTAVKYDLLSADRIREYQCTYTMALSKSLVEEPPDITFIIPTKIDSQDRLENLLTVIEYAITVYGVKHLIVSEYDESPQLPAVLKRFPEVRYCFTQPRPESPWSRSIPTNIAAKLVTTKYLAIWDADILLPYISFKQALIALATTQKVCIPCTTIVNIHRQAIHMFRNHLLSGTEVSQYQATHGQYNTTGVIAATASIMMHTDLFLHIRGMSELFHGFGFEDVEFAGRLGKFTTPALVQGPLYHIAHARTPTTKLDPSTQERSRYEALRVHGMSSEECCSYYGITPEIASLFQAPPDTGELPPLSQNDHSVVMNKEDNSLQLLVNPLW